MNFSPKSQNICLKWNQNKIHSQQQERKYTAELPVQAICGTLISTVTEFGEHFLKSAPSPAYYEFG